MVNCLAFVWRNWFSCAAILRFDFCVFMKAIGRQWLSGKGGKKIWILEIVRMVLTSKAKLWNAFISLKAHWSQFANELKWHIELIEFEGKQHKVICFHLLNWRSNKYSVIAVVAQQSWLLFWPFIHNCNECMKLWKVTIRIVHVSVSLLICLFFIKLLQSSPLPVTSFSQPLSLLLRKFYKCLGDVVWAYLHRMSNSH